MTTVKLQFRAEKLDKMDFFGLGKSDPYLSVEQKTGDNETFQQIYKTEFIKNESSPTWKPFHLNFEEENPELKITVFDRDKHCEDDLIGSFETKLSELLDYREVKFECLNENRKGKSKIAGTVVLIYGKRAVGLKLGFRADLLSPTPKFFSLSLSERFLKGKKQEKEMYETDIIRASSKEVGEWKLIETAAEDVENLLHIQVFKHYQVSEPVLKGEFFVELKKLLEEKLSNVSFDLYKKNEKTGTISLITCKVNLPPSTVLSKNIETGAPPPPPPPPPPPVAPPLPPPPPGPPMPSKKEQSDDAAATFLKCTSKHPIGDASDSQDDSKDAANTQNRPKDATNSEDHTDGATNPQPKSMKRERSMLDEIREFQEKKKLKKVEGILNIGQRPVASPRANVPVPRPRTNVPHADNAVPKPSMNVLDIMKHVEGFEMAEEDEKDDTGEWSD